MDGTLWEVAIVGGGPAGLSAALLLGRCRRRVCVFDDGRPRNARAQRLGGYLTRDGLPPETFLQIARQELEAYDNVRLQHATVCAAQCVADRFELRLDSGETVCSRKLLVATGLVDDLPAIDGLEPLYGTSVHHCAYCDGWEIRDQPVAVLGSGDDGAALALQLTHWTADVVLCLHGGDPPTREQHALLAARGVAIRAEAIARLDGRGGQLQRVVFTAGPALARHALFFDSQPRQRSPLLEMLGCRLTEKNDVPAGTRQTTAVPGLYVAGDAGRSVRLVIVAAAEGAEAAFDIHSALHQEDLAAQRP